MPRKYNIIFDGPYSYIEVDVNGSFTQLADAKASLIVHLQDNRDDYQHAINRTRRLNLKTVN